MLNMKWTLSAVMLAGALATTASAQSQSYRGTFNLQFEARFGNTVLPPGNYSVSTIDGAKGVRIVGETKTVSILSTGYDVKPEAKKATMVFVDSNGTYTLRSYQSGLMGKALYFSVGKAQRGTSERAAVRPSVEVGMQ
jgi:hypothetical protein